MVRHIFFNEIMNRDDIYCKNQLLSFPFHDGQTTGTHFSF